MAKRAVAPVVALGLATLTATAGAATLVVRVAPASLHPDDRYAITISGRFDRQWRRGPRYLLAFIQYSAKPCQATATAEYRQPRSDWDWVFYPQRREASSPFRSLTHWKAGPRLGTRRVCAYLYARRITPASAALPVATASGSFRNLRR